MKEVGRNKAYERLHPNDPKSIKVLSDEEFIAREKEKMRKLKEALRKPPISIIKPDESESK